MKSPYEIWKKKDVTKLLNGGKAKQVSTTSIDGNSVVIYSITEGNKVHRVYYSKKYKVWLKYEIYIDNKLDEKWTIKKFSVGKVTDAQADYKTKLPGHPEQEGYALINISEMIK